MPKKCGTGFTKVWIPPVLDSTALDVQRFLFVLTMKNNSKVAMAKPCAYNPLTRLWRQLTSSQIITHKTPKQIKMAKIIVAQIIGSMEDERCFSTFNFMKTKFKNG